MGLTRKTDFVKASLLDDASHKINDVKISRIAVIGINQQCIGVHGLTDVVLCLFHNSRYAYRRRIDFKKLLVVVLSHQRRLLLHAILLIISFVQGFNQIDEIFLEYMDIPFREFTIDWLANSEINRCVKAAHD